MIFGQNIAFWITVLGASVVKLLLSPWHGVVPTLVSFAAAVFFAVVFTDPVLAYLNLNPEAYKIGAAAVVALTGEAIAKRVLGILADQNSTFSFIQLWRNKNGSDSGKDE